jgi:hypothetical protein
MLNDFWSCCLTVLSVLTRSYRKQKIINMSNTIRVRHIILPLFQLLYQRLQELIKHQTDVRVKIHLFISPFF